MTGPARTHVGTAREAELEAILIAVRVEEINGLLCPRPESHKDRCCPVCRDLWRRIDAALEPEEAESRV